MLRFFLTTVSASLRAEPSGCLWRPARGV